MELNSKTALITGGSSGIGKAIAELFIEKGMKVIILGLNKPDYPSEFHKVDLKNEKEILSALSKINKIDILVNNAGIAKVTKLQDTSSKDFDEMFNVNFRGMFLVSKYCLPKLNKNSCIINISSLAGIKSFSEYSVYCATKSAVISLTKTLALELADKKIRANCIAPGIIDTGIWGKMYGKNGRKELKENEKFVLLKRSGKPEEIAQTAVFICENDYINGETILVDGGESIQ